MLKGCSTVIKETYLLKYVKRTDEIYRFQFFLKWIPIIF